MKWLVEFLESQVVHLFQICSPKKTISTKDWSDTVGVSAKGERVRLTTKDLEKHAWFIGSTGAGKSSAILVIVERDLLRNETIIIIDLRGDLVEEVLALCDRLDIDPERVVLLDLRSKDRIQSFDPLSGAGEPYVRALHLLAVLSDNSASWGVRIEELLRNAFLVLAIAKQPITKLEALLYDEVFRAQCLEMVDDEPLLGFWERYGASPKDTQQAWAMPSLNKVTPLLAVPVLRMVLGGNSPLDLKEILDSKGKVFLVSLAVDELHRSSRMLASLIVSSISREMMARIHVHKRRRARLVVDEFENMASESFEELIAEGRRFGLTLLLSHQTMAQMPSRLLSVIRNNVGLQAIFQVGYEDAKVLAAELPKEIQAADLRGLSVGQAVIAKRSGSAQIIQFDAPKKPWPSHLISAYRERVLQRIPKIQATTEPKFKLLEVTSPDTEDWL